MKPPTATHQEKQVMVENGKPIFFEPPKVKEARAKLMAHLGQHVPRSSMTGPLRVIVKWCFPLTGKRSHGQFKDTRPDAHNLNKLLFDCMTDLKFWNDDAQVASEIIEKFWSEKPGIFIQIEKL
ncbi:RusA family crossover junction endodeoxyribonuclease [Rubellicoccus peritrichatus]|uniref:RusA family crossover junction endodeoxyribonuclease n=1 Tax=Rubellicoccus peritrichatus TaxID=3080537 RepID=A0AAQ3QV37_9BACT|nr:RusA family crossover junction endodeoxyribonuclease [Puniceicoccus sp. CR14]WOO40389.1 RusA family crossover junction endodeoxyribonuclease [Puniceicoccus sp. CR14]WOO40438.1 RusA family crossover junction endodeoxyribonuclease [Puniceicoccus sp. CR14]WOO40487.1 RusA family crossover junction endodeoxyribonuclease [Puniceicoccus sp. CR14]WOO40536.1 RusA family crossover junction endodeoxyribonuclease [Puniceicoccus sp. CR14]